MKNLLKKTLLLAAMACVCGFYGCGGDDNPAPADDQDGGEQTVTTDFAKGADVSWVTEMESKGVKFYDKNGNEKECMTLMKELGMNSIRLRVWVNPSGGWNGKADVLAKAKRAHDLGMRLMIDFHYSDTWADPGNQTPPAAWSGYSVSQLEDAVADHTKDILSTLKNNGIDVEWVQVGNEVSWGMLWESGKILNDNFTNFTRYINAGYDAVKSVYPNAKVIVHSNNGYDRSLLTWLFDGLRTAGGKWDVIGLSLYPEGADGLTWQQATTQCLNNFSFLVYRYDKDVMICEIGAPWDSANAASIMTTMVDGCKAADRCLGIFYWEPEAHNGWNGYTLGAFDNSGRPTSALDAFAD